MERSAAFLAVGSYLSGGVPSGYLIARYRSGIDIREHGSGNPGAANVFRVLGPGPGLATLACDALKGYLPVLAAKRLFPEDLASMALCGALAVVGHIWTVFLAFQGGKGVATSAGVFAGLLPGPLAAAAAVFAAVMLWSGHISAGSMAAAAALPAFAALSGAPAPFMILAFGASALVLARHIPNLRALIRGSSLRRLLEK